ncbi:3-dehydroquinate synthase [Ancylobacter amanitiformis]|uniref:3-dehydroquinate synthase n=1 Tax=Ancylobacter amanitiformis TaxID=217069 RepID=A0ABU0LP23_9HYPH|nr:3-dehydroquinate synthase [Ancylobacter amanitiformis]MDQ0510457.1 3-dehydroquinate synthase [Ancylobacter amanitiformis]
MSHVAEELRPDITRLNVGLGERAYDILIGPGLFHEAGERIARLRPGARVGIVTDRHVAERHLATVEAALRAAGLTPTPVIVEPGEKSKCFRVFEEVVDALLAARIERRDLVLALGGGVVGDLAGFAAAALRRGVDFVQAPTSLLAQVDSSVGGKTGINSRHGKNLVGAFHQPILVLADSDALDTLPLREFRAGYAEVAKYGLIDNAPFFGWLERKWQEVFEGGPARIEAIATSCASKAAVVSRDEKETGDRALLNLGHTFGHALEAGAGFSQRLLHGEAVAVGMAQAFRFSARQGLCTQADAVRVATHLKTVGLPTRIQDIPGDLPDTDGLMDLIAQDKKVSRGALTFILARGIGRSFIARDVDPAELRAFLEAERAAI